METSGLRERKKLKTATTIEEKALRLFSERGYDATTVDDIAAAADVAPRTFFRYFPTKEDVVLGHYAERMALLGRALAGRPDDEPAITAVRHAYAEVARDFESKREGVLQRALLIATKPSLRARNLELQIRWERVIAEAVAPRLGVGIDDPRVVLLSACAVTAMRVSLETWVAEGGTSSLPERLDRSLDLIERGLGR
ncbi:MAG: TetR family transcriptional regulator [Actinobacteria bacterium]|nr:TetR family transcriptional regulator [Actinomycetota bacterium]